MKKSKANRPINNGHRQKISRSERLAEELRANLRRRKEREHGSVDGSTKFATPLQEKQKDD